MKGSANRNRMACIFSMKLSVATVAGSTLTAIESLNRPFSQESEQTHLHASSFDVQRYNTRKVIQNGFPRFCRSSDKHIEDLEKRGLPEIHESTS